jgi:hypothetical protein
MNTEKAYEATAQARLIADEMLLATRGNSHLTDHHFGMARHHLASVAEFLGYRLEPLPTDADLAEKAKLAGEVA